MSAPRDRFQDKAHRDRVKEALKGRALALARTLAPDCERGGGVDGDNYFALNPTRADRSVGSFYIAVKGPYCGAWCDKATGDEGDIFQFIAYVKGWRLPAEFGDVMGWAERWLGITLGEASGTAKRMGAAPTRKTAAPTTSRPFNAKGTWLSAKAGVIDTDADIYFGERKIDLRKLARQPGALRYSPSARYYYGDLPREEYDRLNDLHGMVFDGIIKRFYTQHPCIVSAMVSAANDITCVHRTYLAKGGHGKADVPKPKKMRGDKKGSVIRLARGEGQLTEKQAIAKGQFAPLCLIEGIEDGLTVAILRPDWRVWVVGDVGNFRAMDWPDCAREIILIGDNDDAEEALEAFEAAKVHYAKQAHVAELERVLKAFRAPIGTKDMNAWLCGQFTRIAA
ncbi:MAG: hypothetical protein COA69_13550 [Robiginitomaculum sp.]|nr:MAG: hypothetical protein COA69_13550 [Robiginitomaculum sp.]